MNDVKLRVFHILYIISVSFLLLIIFSTPSIADENDTILFFPPSLTGIETHTFFHGETDCILQVSFPMTCSNWSIDLNSSLFTYPFSDNDDSQKNAFDIHLFGLEIDSEAPLGDYSIQIYLNFTDEFNVKHALNYDYSITYIQVFIVTRVDLPSKSGDMLELEVEILESCELIKIEFLPTNDVVLDDNTIQRSDLDPGIYTFKTKARHQEGTGGAVSSIGYRIKVTVDSRTAEYRRYDIPIDWQSDGQSDDNSSPTLNLAAIIIIIMVVIIVNYVVIRYWLRSR